MLDLGVSGHDLWLIDLRTGHSEIVIPHTADVFRSHGADRVRWLPGRVILFRRKELNLRTLDVTPFSAPCRKGG